MLSAFSSKSLLTQGHLGLVLHGFEPGTSQANGIMKFAFKFFLGQRLSPVGRYPDAALLQIQQFDGFVTFARAENQSDGLVLTFLALIAVKPPQVKLHLPFVAGLEFRQLQFDGHQPTQMAVIEQ